MAYVPTHVPQASPQTQELAHKLEHVIREYRQSHPGMSPGEVGMAIQMAQSRTGVSSVRSRMLMVALLGATVALVLGTLLFWRMG